jgi:hypothetical protein
MSAPLLGLASMMETLRVLFHESVALLFKQYDTQLGGVARLAQCRFVWKLTGDIVPILALGQLASCNHAGVFGAVKGGRCPAQRTLDGIENAFTLKGLGLDAGLASGPRARPAARTAPPLRAPRYGFVAQIPAGGG